MSRATAMADRAREAELLASGHVIPRKPSRIGWKILAVLAGAGVAYWIFSPGSRPEVPTAGPTAGTDPNSGPALPAGATAGAGS